jgi:hypothetical protein
LTDPAIVDLTDVSHEMARVKFRSSQNYPYILIRPHEVLSGIPNTAILEVARGALAHLALDFRIELLLGIQRGAVAGQIKQRDCVMALSPHVRRV